MIQIGLDGEAFKTSKIGKNISKSLKDNREKSSKAALMTLLSKGCNDDVIKTLCSSDMSTWFEDIGCSQDTLRIIMENNINGEAFLAAGHRELSNKGISAEDLQKITAEINRRKPANTTPSGNEHNHRTNSILLSESSSGSGREFSSDGSGSTSSSSNSIGSSLGSSGDVLIASDDSSGASSGYGKEMRVLLSIEEETVCAEMPEIDSVLSECDAYVQSNLLKNPANLKFITDAKLSRAEVFMLSMLRFNNKYVTASIPKLSFRDYVLSRENDVSVK